MVVSSTEIEVSWEEVPAINENGVITIYEVLYTPLMTFGGQIATDSVNTTVLNITLTGTAIVTAPATTTNLTGLQEYVEYSISVRAYTSVGPGPYSDPLTRRTLEDGKAVKR